MKNISEIGGKSKRREKKGSEEERKSGKNNLC
jgi:hypothetical protein